MSLTSTLRHATLCLLLSASCATLDEGLILRYGFDGAYTDDAGRLPLAPSGMQAFVAGREAGSLAASFSPSAGTLPGSGSHLSSDTTSLLPAGASPRTIAAWVRVNQGDCGSRTVASWGATATTWWTGVSLRLQFCSRLLFEVYGPALEVDASFDDGQWHHVATTFDGTRARLFFDGVSLPSTTDDWSGSLATPASSRLFIGHLNPTWVSFQSHGTAVHAFSGAIDELRIYNRPLSSAEMMMLVNPPSSSASMTRSHSQTETPSSSQTATASSSQSASSTASFSSSMTVTPTSGQSCPPTLFRSFTRTDLVGALVTDAPLATATEGACRIACCGVPGCQGYAFAFTELRFSSAASCSLYTNVSATVPNSFAASSLLASVLVPAPPPSASSAGTPLPGWSQRVGSASATVSASQMPSATSSPGPSTPCTLYTCDFVISRDENGVGPWGGVFFSTDVANNLVRVTSWYGNASLYRLVRSNPCYPGDWSRIQDVATGRILTHENYFLRPRIWENLDSCGEGTYWHTSGYNSAFRFIFVDSRTAASSSFRHVDNGGSSNWLIMNDCASSSGQPGPTYVTTSGNAALINHATPALTTWRISFPSSTFAAGAGGSSARVQLSDLVNGDFETDTVDAPHVYRAPSGWQSTGSPVMILNGIISWNLRGDFSRDGGRNSVGLQNGRSTSRSCISQNVSVPPVLQISLMARNRDYLGFGRLAVSLDDQVWLSPRLSPINWQPIVTSAFTPLGPTAALHICNTEANDSDNTVQVDNVAIVFQPTRTPGPTPAPSDAPYCIPSLFRDLPRMDLVGTLVGTALSPGLVSPAPSLAACRQACCDAPACDGFSFASGDSSLLPGGTGVAGCFLLVNITQLIPNNAFSSGVYESTL